MLVGRSRSCQTGRVVIAAVAVSTASFVFAASRDKGGNPIDSGARDASGSIAGLPVIQTQPRMGEPLHGLTPAQLDAFNVGRNSYIRVWQVPEGLGPIFNQNSCGACHNNPVGGTGNTTVTRFGAEEKGVFTPLAEYGGSLHQAQGINAGCEEHIPDLPGLITAQRVTNGALGYGLIEAIPDEDLLFYQNNPPYPGISGRAAMVQAAEDPKGSPDRVGRFGWKAQVATVLTFSGDASIMEMGITNRLFPEENDPNGIFPPSIEECDTVADPEDVPDGQGRFFIDKITDFQRYLAAPPQTPKSGMTGEALFTEIGCTHCHVRDYTTSNSPLLEEAIRNKPVVMYSDFLLHDMGLLGDSIEQLPALGREMRTPPLAGLRMRDPILHDGRIGGGTFEFRIQGAVQFHDVFLSEARESAQRYLGTWGGGGTVLSPEQRNQVLQFLDSLGRAEFDYNGDNVRDVDDFNAFRACWGGGPYTADDACAIGDINQDGFINEADFYAFLSVYEGITGDCNNNGINDLLDILNGTLPDVNGDGVPDGCDYCPADLDNSGNVGPSDLGILLGAWGNPGCGGSSPCLADLNGDGSVGPADLGALLGNWGPCN